MTIRVLTIDDLAHYKQMQTGLETDYMIDIFERLTTPPHNQIYGFFIDNQLVATAGYTLYPGGYAMLGRLRSDVRFRGRGYATSLLTHIIQHLKNQPHISFLGGYTNLHNTSARQVLNKLNFNPIQTFYSFPLINRDKLGATSGPIWNEVTDLNTKRRILNELSSEGTMSIYPYECYYPFPFTDELLPDDKLKVTRFFHNPDVTRWLLIDDDYKREAYGHVRYFWDDYFTQPGLFETVDHYLAQSDQPRKAWFNFTPDAYQKIPDLDAFETSDGWILYGYNT
ncbi:FR47-like protein [Pelagirhabdus alkalitolerans]|uniref:FR47-like protein n=1 Tax=Pelagirhabdus alkalitolerans TaxID=1612202 RepID=A0A1G6KA08_9BACI|nr:GNAT family N-acetyltransferase [Pelagirhabdus alkalitolerans]SDC27773.1 FR47-like protein [Pelagirhabdus alkalitolerans]